MNPLGISFSMFWEVFWPLSLGFLISAVIQSKVSHSQMSKLLGKDSLRCFSLATVFGVASSSCSYAAVALARSIFKKGATFTSSMIFELASTNLVIELGVVLWVLLGWQFLAAEILGGLIMIFFISLIFKLTLSKKLVEEALNQANKGMVGKMEAHAEMDMSKGDLTSVSHYFVMDWYSVWIDLALGFLIAGALAAFVPNTFWQAFFLKGNPTLSFWEGPLIGPLVAMISFVCSVGNIPLAAVLWSGGISFGGVVSFIFADLIVLPILDIYRKYYGVKMMGYILVTFYISMAAAGYITEIIFSFLGIIPQNHQILITQGVGLNYTSFLDIIFLGISLILLARSIKTKGLEMLKMM